MTIAIIRWPLALLRYTDDMPAWMGGYARWFYIALQLTAASPQRSVISDIYIN